MIADLMPTWLWRLLRMNRANLSDREWTWRHTFKYGRDPAKIATDEARYRRKLARRHR